MKKRSITLRCSYSNYGNVAGDTCALWANEPSRLEGIEYSREIALVASLPVTAAAKI